MSKERLSLKNPAQVDRGRSPWSRRERLGILLWRIAWVLLYRPSPKPLVGWRRFLLRSFGATIEGKPFISESSIVRVPWLLTMEAASCLGERAEVYNLGPVTLKARCVVAQQVYLCAGTHDLENPVYPLVVGPIVVGEDAFIGARALVLPGVVIGDGAVIGAGSVVAKDMPGWSYCAGNPCRVIRPRPVLKQI